MRKLIPLKIIASFPSIKQSIDGDIGDLPLVSTRNALVQKYQLDGDNTYILGCNNNVLFSKHNFKLMSGLKQKYYS